MVTSINLTITGLKRLPEHARLLEIIEMKIGRLTSLDCPGNFAGR